MGILRLTKVSFVVAFFSIKFQFIISITPAFMHRSQRMYAYRTTCLCRSTQYLMALRTNTSCFLLKPFGLYWFMLVGALKVAPHSAFGRNSSGPFGSFSIKVANKKVNTDLKELMDDSTCQCSAMCDAYLRCQWAFSVIQRRLSGTIEPSRDGRCPKSMKVPSMVA